MECSKPLEPIQEIQEPALITVPPSAPVISPEETAAATAAIHDEPQRNFTQIFTSIGSDNSVTLNRIEGNVQFEEEQPVQPEPVPVVPVKARPRRGESTRRSQRYRKAWESFSEFAGWLAPHENPLRACCTFCKKVMLAELTVIKFHATSRKHCALVNQYKNASKALDQIRQQSSQDQPAGDDWEGEERLDPPPSSTSTPGGKSQVKLNGIPSPSTSAPKTTLTDPLLRPPLELPKAPDSPIIGEPAPFWKGTAVINSHVTNLKLTDYRGRYLIFLFYPYAFVEFETILLVSAQDPVNQVRLKADYLGPGRPTELLTMRFRSSAYRTDVLRDGSTLSIAFDMSKNTPYLLASVRNANNWSCKTSTAEVNRLSDRISEFRKLHSEVVACSTDCHFSHLAWSKIPRMDGGIACKIPLLSDAAHLISKQYGVLIPAKGHTHRALFVIDPNGILRHMQISCIELGWNSTELLRIIKALRTIDQTEEPCPIDWTPPSEADTA